MCILDANMGPVNKGVAKNSEIYKKKDQNSSLTEDSEKTEKSCKRQECPRI